jgi:hypothetical protein
LTGLKTVWKLPTDVSNGCNLRQIKSNLTDMNLTISKSKMKSLPKLICALAFAFNSAAALAFDIATHAAMTAKAVEQSKITSSPNTGDILKKLGLYDKDFAIGSSYIDIGSLIKRDTTGYEQKVIDDVGSTQKTGLTLPAIHTIPGWIIRGSIREDDNTKETLQGTPEGDEPNGVFDRVYGHFFDPVYNRGLTVGGLTLGPRSPEWATLKEVGVTGFGFSSRQNYYNLPSAREAMWRALTLKEWNNGVLTDAAFPGNWPNSTKEQLREAYWATTFRAVGDMVHLLQDAGQPQHTRNDAHSGYGCVTYTGTCAGGHASFFENYLKARTLGTPQFTLDEGVFTVVPNSGTVREITPTQLDYCCYTKPTFAKPEEFFSTATGGGNATGKGLANYSSRGFYSFGTNIGSPLEYQLPLPSPSGSGLVPVTLRRDSVIPVNRLRDMAGNTLNGEMTFLTGTVVDSIGGGDVSGVKLAAVGVWDQFLQAKGILPRYTLNYYNYDDQARLLIPRAVAYSAGLIDYFFRGELEISLPDEGVYAVVDYSKESTKDTGGFNKVKLKLTNKTPSISPSGGGATVEQKLLPSGKVVAIAKFRRNKCYIENSLQGEIPVLIKDGKTTQDIYDECRAVAEEIVVSDPVTLPRVLAYNDIEPLTFDFKDRIPINVMDLYLQVVYRGQLGDESDAVVVTTKDVSEPTFFKLTDYYLMMAVTGTGQCKYVEPSGTSVSPMKIALNEDPTKPYLVKAELNGKDYSMFAAISDLGPIKSRGEASFNNLPPFLTFNTAFGDKTFTDEVQPGQTPNTFVENTYHQSHFYPTGPNTLTLQNFVAPTLTKIRGVYADAGYFLDNRLDYERCDGNPGAAFSFTRAHSLMPPHNPLVPKALKELNF